ncbi:MAG: hypothetical protein ACO3GK_07200, partial [Bacteroidia bacterium]
MAQLLGADSPGCDGSVRDLVFDSRRATGSEGELFLCLKTSRRDGHDFAHLAYQRGVRFFAVERVLDLPSDAVQLQVA